MQRAPNIRLEKERIRNRLNIKDNRNRRKEIEPKKERIPILDFRYVLEDDLEQEYHNACHIDNIESIIRILIFMALRKQNNRGSVIELNSMSGGGSRKRNGRGDR